MTAEAQVEERSAEYEHWLVLNAADQIVTVGKLLEQQVRTLEYLTPDYVGLAEFEPDLSGIRSNG
ncbi:hypothetical protein K3N28_16840 [Glycomyces sp. TRM65418]|uniref:hypothetical protein n=1 Tax=Glycomyces sp. TRM65418 TaxID=2867006 RepID=UPI001CE66A8B|nr:hypothetical protein [Glycomyces sp. TRM65418]MCC3764726.1 hypothetical protein [Glycomyces sp. TRM65418]QZD54383.1 hypothetical protein K3N28_16755 [Glycomyces sp. TRM65418]